MTLLLASCGPDTDDSQPGTNTGNTDTSTVNGTTLGTSTDTGTDITPVNVAPVVTDIELQGTILVASSTDENDLTVTYAWTVAGNAVVGSSEFLQAPEGVYGTQIVTVVATDEENVSSVSMSKVIDFGEESDSVPNPNEAPVVTDIELQGTILVATATDEKLATVTYAWTVAGNAVAGSSAFLVAPEGVYGSQIVAVIATDEENVSRLLILVKSQVPVRIQIQAMKRQ